MSELLTAEDVRHLLRKTISDKFHSQAEYGHRVGLSDAVISYYCTGERPLSKYMLSMLGLEKVVMYRRKEK
jgi:hypothetical protein